MFISVNCDCIFEDCISGKIVNCFGLKWVLKYVNKGDIFVVWKLDRLGCSVKNLVVLILELYECGVYFYFLIDSIDISSVMGWFFFYVMLVLVEMEWELIVEWIFVGLVVVRV